MSSTSSLEYSALQAFIGLTAFALAVLTIFAVTIAVWSRSVRWKHLSEVFCIVSFLTIIAANYFDEIYIWWNYSTVAVSVEEDIKQL